jgi:large subunit ribosomal protein L23
MSKIKAKNKHFDLILKPIITEKSTLGVENNQITFKVALNATKPEIKEAVETVFGKKVTAVNTLRQQGKVKRFRGVVGKRPDYKKAIVTLAEGETIDITTGV